MKIAVLFGSFNPLTNAHVSVMNAAVSTIHADKGLFVATSSRYLRKKTLKTEYPFCLCDEDREHIISQVCKYDEKLSFWGFELGGASPKRYKTLCKIKKEYPDAEIYEIQGADKLRTISKFSDAEDYVSNTRFVVFDRAGTDSARIIDDDPLLSRHRNAFTVLPSISEYCMLSSTEVRRKFSCGEDYSDLIPSAAYDVLSKYTPEDFSISFEKRMQTLISSSRFGLNAAHKEVYLENARLFGEWQNGTPSIDFGSYRDYLDSAKLYKDEFSVYGVGTVYPETQTGCINIDCVDLAERLIADGYNPAILNLASAKHPAGGYDSGKSAQEESLCRSSNLSLSLYQFGDAKHLKCIRESGVDTKNVGYPFDINFGGIYTPNVTFFRHNKSKFFALRCAPFKCDVISVAALSFNENRSFSQIDEVNYRSASGSFTDDGEAIMLNKIRTIFRMGIEHGKDSLILGAFGCGVYRLPISEVVRMFKTVMNEPEFACKYRLIVFAILESTRKPNGNEGKFGKFYREFGNYKY